MRVQRARSAWFTLGLALLLFVQLIGWSQDAVTRVSISTAPFREDRILIKPRPGAATNTLADLHRRSKTSVVQTFSGMGNLQILRLPVGETVWDLIHKYEASGLVEYAEPDYVVRIAATIPNDPSYLDGTLWGLDNTGQSGGTVDADIDAPEGWDGLTSASNIVVAVIDTGVRYTHEDLAANMWVNPHDGGHGFNALGQTNDPNDDNGHGTRVAGILGGVGDNGKGMVGVAWRVQIMACKFIDRDGVGSTSDAIACIDYARTNGANVINASWGIYEFSQSLSGAVSSARDAGIIFVAAAGNDSRNTDVVPYYPASFEFDNVVSVAATTRDDDLVFYSNFGATSVDLAAPGANIYSTDFLSDSAYAMDEGTSMATPYVTGALALLRAKYPAATHQHIVSRILDATDPIPALAGKCVTGGRLNLGRALNPLLRLSAIPASNGGPFQLQLLGEPDRAYVVQMTTDLLNWAPVFTNTTGTNGAFFFTDAGSTNAPERFYRAVLSP